MKKILSVFVICLVLYAVFTAGVYAVQISDGSGSGIQTSLRGVSGYTTVTSAGSDTFLLGLTPGTLVSGVTSAGCTVTASDDSAVDGTAKVGTGMKVYKNSEIAQVVLLGDVNGDGNIDSADIVSMKYNILFEPAVSSAVAKAEDILKDGSLSVSDMIELKRHLVSITTITQAPGLSDFGTVDNSGWSQFK